MANFCSKKAAKITLWISIPILIFSVAMLFAFNPIYNSVLKKKITLGKGTLVTEVWEDIPTPIYQKLYFFNVTNSKAFVEGTEPLNVSEVGPYTYKSRWIKKNPQWNANNTVSYREVRTYHFVPEMSVGFENDSIYTLNAPLLIAANKAKSSGFPVRFLLSLFLISEGEHVIIKKSVEELSYSGYEDGVIDWATVFLKDIPFKDGKFSWLYGKNATDDGLFTVFTGTDNASKTNFINNWNGKERLNFWKGDTCNMMDGTSIETGPPINGYQESYTFFQSFICRSLTFNYTNDETHFGIPSKRFKSTYDLLANASENPDNYCFNVNGEHPSGVLDLSPCQFGAPVYLSFPHFYFADPSFLNSVNGLNPVEEKHGSYVDVEPVTGFSIDIAIRVQINLEVRGVSGIFQLSDVREGIFPVFWMEMLTSLDENVADFLKSSMRTPKIIAYSVLGILGIASLLLTAISAKVLCSPENKQDKESLISVNKLNESGVKGYDNKIHSNYQNVEKVNSNEKIEKDIKPLDYYATEDAQPEYSNTVLAIQGNTASTSTTVQVHP